LVTCGARQSNHARLTAAAGARLGLHVVLVLTGSGSEAGAGNVALDGLLGASVVWAGDVAHEALNAIAQSVLGDLRQTGARPELIPYGGSSVLGACGYVACGRELLHQAPELATVVTALGSGGTMAGLVHALGARRVLGVDCGAIGQPVEVVGRLVSGLAGGSMDPGTLRIRLDHVGADYGQLTEPVMAAMTLAARTEGLILDPIYTGRALAGLMSAVAESQVKPGECTVLLHSGGLPGLFGHAGAVARSTAALAEFS
jgi:L-cysteate sulfo-lyase